MDIKEVFRRHLLKILLGFILLQLLIFAIVQNLNHKPVTQTDQIVTVEGHPARIAPLSNDADKDVKDTLVLASVSVPHQGTLIRKGNILIYTPKRGFTGNDSLSYTVTDGKKESSPVMIQIRVLPNQAPMAKNDHAMVYAGGEAIVFPLNNDEDKEKDTLRVDHFTQPAYGEVKLMDNKFFYKARKNSVDSDQFTYTTSDGKKQSNQAIVHIRILNTDNPCYPWLITDVGNIMLPGHVACVNHTMKIEASGSDIWNAADGFYFLYQLVSGPCEMSVRIDSLAGPHEWTKSGLMIRDNLSSTSRNVFVGLTPKNGIVTQYRPEDHESSENIRGNNGTLAPYWIKLKNEGDSCHFFISPDGKTWNKLKSIAYKISAPFYMGMAVTSHDQNKSCHTVLSNFRLTGKTVMSNK